jgi:hypothetical protein
VFQGHAPTPDTTSVLFLQHWLQQWYIGTATAVVYWYSNSSRLLIQQQQSSIGTATAVVYWYSNAVVYWYSNSSRLLVQQQQSSIGTATATVPFV